MKLNLKMIAAAAALASLGTANAALVDPTAVGGSSFALLAFNTTTRAFYIRDLGYTLNTFLPTGVTTLATDGVGGVAATGDKSPTTGLTLNSTTNPSNFADASFSTWLTGQTLTDIRWVVNATDSLSSAANGVSRFITSAATGSAWSNGQVTNYVGGANGGGLATLFGTGLTLSSTGTGLGAWADTNGGLGANTLATLGQSVGLYYAARTAATGATATVANLTQFGNSATNFATVTLANNGDFTYALSSVGVSAVPLPGSMWLMGAGLAAMGGLVRRRSAANQA